jgi:sulfur carrier protein
MALTVNGDAHPFREGLTVDQLLIEKRYTYPSKIVVVNGRRVPRAEHETCLLQDGDVVEVIHMMSGG